MRISAIRKQIPLIQRAVLRKEKKLVPPEYREMSDKLGKPVFPTAGPREPWYQGTPIQGLSDHLEKLALPSDLHFVDLGSGLGSACFAAAPHFSRITGIEMNPQFIAEAEIIRKEFGIIQVEFFKEDFMQVPLNNFDIIYFFKPFTDDFVLQMTEKLLETSPRTYIISHKQLALERYAPSAFDCLSSPLPQLEFTTYVRKG